MTSLEKVRVEATKWDSNAHPDGFLKFAKNVSALVSTLDGGQELEAFAADPGSQGGPLLRWATVCGGVR